MWSKVKVTARKRRMIAKLLLYIRKSGFPILMAMSKFLTDAKNSSLCSCEVQMWLKTAQNDWRDVGQPQVAVHSQLPIFSVKYKPIKTFIMPPPTKRGGGIVFGRPSGCPSVVRSLADIWRDAISLYLVREF